MRKPVKDKEEAERILENVMINGILEYVRNGVFPGNNPNSYMDAYTTVKTLADEGDSQSEDLFKYYGDKIKKYIDESYNEIRNEPNSKLVDAFIKSTENINFLVYWMNGIFTYLDRYYTKSNGKNTLA